MDGDYLGGIYTTNPPEVAEAFQILIGIYKGLGYGALDAGGIDARDFLDKSDLSCNSNGF